MLLENQRLRLSLVASHWSLAKTFKIDLHIFMQVYLLTNLNFSDEIERLFSRKFLFDLPHQPLKCHNYNDCNYKDKDTSHKSISKQTVWESTKPQSQEINNGNLEQIDS